MESNHMTLDDRIIIEKDPTLPSQHCFTVRKTYHCRLDKASYKAPDLPQKLKSGFPIRLLLLTGLFTKAVLTKIFRYS